MLRQAFAELPIDRQRSALIGDSVRDIGAARGIGIWAYGVRTGHGCLDLERYQRETGSLAPVPDLMFDGVSEAVDFQLGYSELAAPIVSSLYKLANSKKVPVLVGLCGRSRAGKTTAAHAIVRVLAEQGLDCLHVRLDNWIVPAASREPNSSSEVRNRLDTMPDLIRALRAGKVVRAPGYNAATRGRDSALTYDPAGKSVIVLDGIFAGHSTIRAMLDFVRLRCDAN